MVASAWRCARNAWPHSRAHDLSAVAQHDPSHRPSGGTLDAGEEFRLSRPTAASVMAIMASMSRISILFRAELVSENTVSSPHRSHTTRNLHDGNARSGSFNASSPVGRGSSP